MTIRTKITVCIAALAVLVLLLATALLWSLDRGRYDMERTRLAYEELAGYLELSAKVYRTAKLVRRELGAGEAVSSFDLAAERERLQRARERITTIIEAEEAEGLRDDEDFEEIERLETLTLGLDRLLEGLAQVQWLNATGARTEAVARLDELIANEVGEQLEPLIEDGIADEREELDEALANHDTVRRLAGMFGIGITLLGLVLAVGSVIFLVRQVRRPLGVLAGWADQVSTGDLDARVGLSGTAEFDRLGRQFNHMADAIGRYRRQLETARDTLETTVAMRTEELRDANAELERRDKLRQRFFADVGHELRTPITAVRGEAEIALRARTDREARYREALQQIVKVSGQLTRFVNDIFLIARAEAGIADMRRTSVDLGREVEDAVAQMRPIASAKQARLETSLPTTPVLIAGDPDRLRQLVTILVQNAIEHGQEGVGVEVRVREAGDDVVLEVVDDGPGIPAEDAPNVFDRFYRGNRSAGEGAGLGLPIARSIVLAHHGSIALDTAPGSGTRVTACFAGTEAESIAGTDWAAREARA
jgi:signal transduction histidine kinase